MKQGPKSRFAKILDASGLQCRYIAGRLVLSMPADTCNRKGEPMTIERNRRTGVYTIYTLARGYLFQRVYIGYTRREAIAQFRADLKANR